MSRRVGSFATAVAALGGLVVLYAALRESPQRRASPAVHAFRIDVPAADALAVHADQFPVFEATRGDRVQLVATSQQPGVLHVHGYEQQVPLQMKGEVSLEFQATAAGYFPIHLHHANGVMEHIATLEVQR